MLHCHEKGVFLNRLGALNLIRQIYGDQAWIGNDRNQFAGAWNKADACFGLKNSLRVFIFSADSLENVNKAKTEIRRLFQVGNHSIHINDTQHEAIAVAQILMNENSIHFLNRAPRCTLPRFKHNFEAFRQWLRSEKLPSDSFCVDGSAVLGASGLREPADFDFLHHDHTGITTNMPSIRSHNDSVEHHVFTKDDLIFNPRNHFYCNGIKFVSLQALWKMKFRRGEPKDMADARLIKRCMNTDKRLLFGEFSYQFERNVRRVKNRLNQKAALGISLAKKGLSVLSQITAGA